MELQRDPARGLPAPGRPPRLADAFVDAAASLPHLPGDGRRSTRASRTSTRTRRRAAISGQLQGRGCASSRIVCPAAARPTSKPGCEISHPRLWEPGQPDALRGAPRPDRPGRPRSSDATRIHTGIRSLERQPARTDRPQRPRGRTSAGHRIHEDSPSRGAALTPAQMRQNFQYLRDLGATITRAALPAQPIRARARGPLRDPGLVRDPRLPDEEHALQHRGGAGTRRCGCCARRSPATTTILR